MPDPAKTRNDGGIKFVRQTIAALDGDGLSTIYIVQKGSMKRGVARTVSKNENNVEFKQNFELMIPTGNLTLQFLNPTDKPPASLQSITVIDTTGVPQNVILGAVDDDFGAGTEATLTVDIFTQQG
jgi:hypothetical protein